MVKMQTILHATDFSAPSQYAFDLACSLARDHGARVVALHVVPSPLLAYGGVMTPPPPPPDLWRAAEEGLRQLPAPDPGVRVEPRLAEGDAAAEIVRAAREVNADLIVMGTHGRGALGRLVMGSVAAKVVRKAPCPVLTVRTPVLEPSAAPACEEPAAVR